MLYLYGDASPILKLAIDKAMKDDMDLLKEIKLLQRTKKQLDELKNIDHSPNQKTIDAILKYAKDAGKKK